jgi:predicted RNA-binding protein with TRAM domain
MIAVILLTVLALEAQTSWDLKFRFAPGAVLRYEYSNSYEMIQEVQGQEMKITGGSGAVVKMEPESVNANGDAAVLTSYESMTMNMNMMGKDTIMKQEEIIGKRTRIVLSALGGEISREPVDVLKTENKLANAMGAAFSGNLVRFPGRPVKLGEQWETDLTDTTKIGEGYTASQTKTGYTLVGKEMKQGHECLMITFKAESEITGKIIQMGMEMFIEGTGTSGGTIWFDEAKGVLVSRESNLVQEMTYAITGMNISIPATQTIRSGYRLLE